MIFEYANKVLNGEELTVEEANKLINISDDDTMLLLAMADKIRQKFNNDEVDACAIINARSGSCSENCKFCSQSAHYKTKSQEYPLKSVEEIVTAARKAKEAGAVRFSIVTSGRGQGKEDDFENILKAIKAIREEVKMEVCTSLGILTYDQALQLKKVGITRYHSNLEAAPSYYPNICNTHTYQDKMSTIENAKKAGIRVCSGGILGLGETPEQRVEMAFELKRLNVDSIPLNLLNAIMGTPFEKNRKLTALEILRTFAVYRFVLPKALIRTAGGREDNLRDLQALALNGGMNGIMVGNYLTTAGRPAEADKVMINDLGRTYTQIQL